MGPNSLLTDLLVGGAGGALVALAVQAIGLLIKRFGDGAHRQDDYND